MSGSLFYTPRFRAVNAAGLMLAGARLYVYRAGTSTLAATYADSALTVPHANPVVADSYGEFRPIYLDPDAGYDYRVVLHTADGEQVWAEDGIPAAAGGSGGGTPGPTGTPGLSVAELTIFQRSDTQPSTPSGGSYSFATQTLTAPDGWTQTIPTGSAPAWASAAVAAAEGATGTDDVLDWSTPVRVFADGASVDIVFKRSASQPATPAPSAGVPSGWSTDVDSVPVTSDLLWSSVGTRAHAGENWVWQLPIQIEGGPGPQGADASLYYLKPLDGTAIKNGTGSLRVEAHRVFGGNDVLLSSGVVQIYEGTTAKGYSVTYTAAEITGAAILTLKDGPSGNVYDSISLVDVADGTADTGKNAVYGYIEADGPLVWVRGSDGSTWTPSDATLQFDCTFVQGGAEVARVAHVLTRASDGTITGAAGTHSGGDLNGSRVTVTEVNEGTSVVAIKFFYSLAGDEALVSETAFSSMSGTAGATGATGATGAAGYTLLLTRRTIPLQAYQNGTVTNYADANGVASVWQGATDVTAATTFAISASSGVSGATINTAANTPINGQPKGYYQVTALTADVGSITVQAVHSGNTLTETVAFSRSYVGYEIVASLPVTNLFAGRMVFLTADGKLYRYTGGAWTRAVDGADISANSVTTDAMFAGTITTAKLRVTQLSVLSADAGTLTAGVLQSASGNTRLDLTNARVLYNSAPGQAGGYVRVQGAGFGPSLNYLDWYGPKPAGQTTDSGIIANLTDGAAQWFLKTDGSQYSKRTRGEYEPKAWVVFNGSGGAVIEDCYNVASVTRTSAGQYTITFAAALANATYVVSGTAHDAGSTLRFIVPTTRTTGGLAIQTRGTNNAGDSSYVAVIVFGSNVVGGSNVGTGSGYIAYGGGSYGGGNIP